ncbi:MAG: YdcF family protein [Candidatus Doudnabacteria bacterium]
MKLSKTKKIFIAVALIVNVVFLTDVTIVYGLPKYQPQIDQTADAVIVLGAAINSPTIEQRTIKGLEVYESGAANLIIFSGGKIAPSDVSEAQYMQKVALSRASQDLNYLLEDQSQNTFENMNNSKALLESRLGKTAGEMNIVIVSDEYHIGRAVMIAKRAGFETVYWRSPDPSYYHIQELKYSYFRELVAMFRYIPRFISG